MYNTFKESDFIKQGELTMKVEVFESEQGNYNLQDYEKTYQDFDWDKVKKLSWNETGKINMAYECIDRHVDNGKGDKIALNYRDEKRKEQYSFNELKVLSNKAANVLVDKANVQKGIVYLSLCQERLNYILPFWVF